MLLLRSFLLGLSSLGAAFGASAGHAASFIDFNGTTGVFGNSQVSSPAFTDIIDLGSLAAGAYRISGTLSSSYQAGDAAAQDIDFTSVKLNDTDFDIGQIGQFEFRYVSNVISAGSNLFSISGTSGANASYSGTVNVAAVPEPSSWALLFIGFGAVGFAMRGRNRSLMLQRAQL